MKKPETPQENPYGLIGKIYEGNKKSHQSRLLSIYIGGALVIAFLFMASLAPQLGERLGNLAVKKQTQQSLAARGDTPTLSFKVIPWPKNYQDLISTLMEQAVNFERTGALIGAQQNRQLAQALQVSGIDLSKPLGYYSAGNVMALLKIKMNNQGTPEAIWRPLFNSLIRLDQILKSYLDYTQGGLIKITGQTSTLSWSATNVDTCVASGGWSGQKAISGSETVSPAQTTTYFLRCTGSTDVVESVTITVDSGSPAPTPAPTPTPTPAPTALPNEQADTDGDGFSNFLEKYLGTDPNRACGENTWPPDFNNSKKVDIFDNNFLAPPRFGTQTGDANFDKRYDLNGDSKINIDDVNVLKNYFFKTCS